MKKQIDQIFELITEPLIRINSDLKIIFFNHSTERELGISINDSINKAFFNVSPDDKNLILLLKPKTENQNNEPI